MLEELKGAKRVVGAKQTRRAILAGQVKALFLAADADPALTGPLAQLAEEKAIPVDRSASMKALGQTCSIAVGAAVAAILI